MTKNVKKGIIMLTSGLGVVVLLVGLFTNLYGFLPGLIGAIAIWIVSAALSTMLGVKNEKK
ncbi:hypothetical protein KKH43_03330 [Patescibacteria group bacterium]|nr:hypothetical protein [Patescibacteria group bacterium]